MRKVGLVAGGGILPRAAADAVMAAGNSVHVVALDGHARLEDFEGLDCTVCRLGAVGAILEALHSAGVDDVCMIGKVSRPSLSQLRPDKRAIGLIARYGFGALGDDALLRAVAKVLISEGFRLVGVHHLIGGVLLSAGSIGSKLPTPDELMDIGKGLKIARKIGQADIGQAIVIQQGVILAVEAIEGTDRLIGRTKELVFPGRGPILVKACKPQQDSRLDLPTIGPTTIHNAAAAGFSGVAAEAGRTLVADLDNLRNAADEAHIFVYGANDGEEDARRD
jgi:UDP-2,3-diacylglucosamine hydrolase